MTHGGTTAAIASDTARRRRARSGLPLLLWLAAAALALGAAVAWVTIDQRAARREGLANADVSRALAAVQIDVLDAETGQRGYLLTGEPAYLGPYSSARMRIAGDLDRLDSLYRAADVHRAPANLLRLHALVEAKLDELDQTVKLYESAPHGAAAQVVRTDAGKPTMDSLRLEARRLSDFHLRLRAAAFDRTGRADTLLLPLELALGAAIVALILAGLNAERRRARAAREANRVAALRRANDRAELLLRELNHRVKNIFSVIMAIVALAGRRHPEAKPVTAEISARIHALALAHSASLGEADVDSVPLRAVLERTLQPYHDDHERVTIDGPEQAIPVRAVTPLGLILHELCTNAVKHGALAVEGGKVRVDWKATPGGTIELRWIESLPDAFPGRIDKPGASGFGTTMIDMAARQLGGTVAREWREDGLALSLVFQVS